LVRCESTSKGLHPGCSLSPVSHMTPPGDQLRNARPSLQKLSDKRSGKIHRDVLSRRDRSPCRRPTRPSPPRRPPPQQQQERRRHRKRQRREQQQRMPRGWRGTPWPVVFKACIVSCLLNLELWYPPGSALQSSCKEIRAQLCARPLFFVPGLSACPNFQCMSIIWHPPRISSISIAHCDLLPRL